MNNKSLIGEIWIFLKVRKAWWLATTILMLIIVDTLIIIGHRGFCSKSYHDHLKENYALEENKEGAEDD